MITNEHGCFVVPREDLASLKRDAVLLLAYAIDKPEFQKLFKKHYDLDVETVEDVFDLAKVIDDKLISFDKIKFVKKFKIASAKNVQSILKIV
jgi:hypothetical protein